MMNLKTKIAVTGVSNLHDARYCAGMGVDWIVFPIDSALPQAVSKGAFAEIIGWVTGPLFFGEVVSMETTTISDFPIDGILTNQVSVLQHFGSEMPVALRVATDGQSTQAIEALLAANKSLANWFLLEASTAWIATNTSWLKQTCLHYPILLAADFDPEGANEAVEQLAPLGLSLQTGKEIKVGLNDFDGLADVLEAMELED